MASRGKGALGRLLLLLCLFLVGGAVTAAPLFWDGQELRVDELATAEDLPMGPAGARVLLGEREIARRDHMAAGRPRLVDLRRTGRQDLLLTWIGGGTGRHVVVELYGMDAATKAPRRLAVLGEDGSFLRGRVALRDGFLVVEHELAGYLPRAGGMRRRLFHRWRRGRFVVTKREDDEPSTFVDRMNLACACRGEGDSARACSLLEAVLADPTLGPFQRADASDLLARILRSTGRIEEAGVRAKTAVQLAPDAATARGAADRMLRQKLSRLGLSRPREEGRP